MTALLDAVARAQIAPMLDDIESGLQFIIRHSICGQPSDEDMTALFRRVARRRGSTPEDARRWWEISKSETEKDGLK